MKKWMVTAVLCVCLTNLAAANGVITLNKEKPESGEEVYFISTYKLYKVYFVNLTPEELSHFSQGYSNVREFSSDPVRRGVFLKVLSLPHLVVETGKKFPFPPTNFVMVTAHDSKDGKILSMRIFTAEEGENI
jgi:hypothetical protein